MDRRTFLMASAGAVAGAACATTSEQSADKPLNVLFIMTDQHYGGCVGYAGHPDVRTPNLDALAASGVVFDNATCVFPVCTASRCSILTSLWPHTHGNNPNCGLPEKDPNIGLPPDAVMTEPILYNHGYTTKHRGKWHSGDQARHACYNAPDGYRYMQKDYPEFLKRELPLDKLNPTPSPDMMRGYPAYLIPEMHAAHERFKATVKTRNKARYYDVFLTGDWSVPADYRDDALFTDQCLELLDTYRDVPFMVTCSMNAPHSPWTISDPHYSMYDPAKLTLPTNLNRESRYKEWWGPTFYDSFAPDTEACVREYLRCYYAMVSHVDDQVGRLVKKLKDIGQYENTLIIFTADHGDMVGAHSCVTKTVGAFYNEIVEVPLLMHCPKLFGKKGCRVQTAAMGIDLMPTILDYLDMPVPDHCQGRSLREYIEGDEDLDRVAFCERTMGDVNRLIRTPEWHYSFFYRGPHLLGQELYNVHNDPDENTNLADDPKYKDVMYQLDDQLRQHLSDTNDPWMDGIPTLS